MSQITANTATVTSTTGKVWTNKPVNPPNVVRFVCDVEVIIDGCDSNKYPAIRFDLTNKAIQYWVYPNTGLRDSDCSAIEDAIGPPPSDYLAYWDIDNDGLPDLDPDAVFIGGASGTHQADQLYFDQTGVPNPMPIPFDGIIEVRRLGVPSLLATLDAANGANMALVGNWTGAFAADIAANIVGTVGHTNLVQFAKLSFALSVSPQQINSRAAEIKMKIKTRKSGDLSGNTGNILNLTVNQRTGNLFGADQLFFDGGLLYMPQRINSVSLNQGVIVIKDDDRKWSKNNFKNSAAIPDRGLLGSIFDWPQSPTGKALLLAGIDDDQGSGGGIFKETWIVPIESYDVDGLPVFDDSTRVYVNAVGLTSGGLATGGNDPIAHPTLQLNGTPVLIVCKPGVSGTGYIMVNTATQAAPNYDTYLQTYTIDTRFRSVFDAQFDAQGRVYIVTNAANSPAPLGYGVFRLTYSGNNNNQSDLINPANWSFEEIGFAGTYSAPTASGDGQTASYRGEGLAIDETTIVNGEPTIYMSDRAGQVIFRITRNLNNFGDGRDWDFIIVLGQADISGNAEGIGTAAQFFSPIGLAIKDKTLYVAEKFGAKVRNINLSTLQTATWFGVDTVRAHLDQLDY